MDGRHPFGSRNDSLTSGKRSRYSPEQKGKMKTFWATCVCLPLTLVASADSFVYNFDTMDGLTGLHPQGPPPWLTATFTDSAPGVVRVEFSAAGLVDKELVEYWYFNVSPEHAGNLTLSVVEKVGAFQVEFFQDQAWIYDLHGTDLAIALYPHPYSFVDLFGPGDSLIFDLTSSVDGLNALDFLVSLPPTARYSRRPVYTVADISGMKGTGTLGSVIVLAPTVADSGSSLMLVAGGCLAVFGLRGRRSGAPSVR